MSQVWLSFWSDSKQTTNHCMNQCEPRPLTWMRSHCFDNLSGTYSDPDSNVRWPNVGPASVLSSRRRTNFHCCVWVYSGKTGWTPELSIPWLLLSPCQEHTWYRLLRIEGSLSSRNCLCKLTFEKCKCNFVFPWNVQGYGICEWGHVHQKQYLGQRL